MTTPTQAQVEAAANGIPRATAYAEQIIENSDRFSDEVVNLAEQYLHFRDAAAAQVVDTPPIAQVLHRTDAQDLADAKAAAQVADDTISDLTTGGKPTAQVGEKFSAEKYRALPKYDAETIERCAQVAEQHWIPGPPSSIGEDIAAAIRKLKDE